MPIPRDERHYRRGLILGLTLSEIMLLLLFLLLLLLSYLMGKEEDKRDKLQAELTGITGELRATASVNSGLVDQIKELETNIKELQRKLSASQPISQKLDGLRSTLQEIVQKHDPLLSRGEPISDDFEELVPAVADIVSKLSDDVSGLREKLSNLDESEQSLRELESKLAEASGAIEALQEQKGDVQQKLTEAREDIKRLGDELDKLQSVVAELEDDNNNLSEQNTQLVEGAEQSGDQQKVLENQVEDLKRSIDDAEARARDALLTGMYESRKTLLERLQEEMRNFGHSDIDVDFQHGVLRLPEDVLFHSGDAEFDEKTKPKGIEAVRDLAKAMGKWIPCYTADRHSDCEQLGIGAVTHALSAIFVEGHTDNVPVRRDETRKKYKDNWGLSSARAINTYKKLRDINEKLAEYRNSENQPLLSISAYSKFRPAYPHELLSNQKRNRRIDLRFLFSPTPNAQLKKAGSRQNRVIESIGGIFER